MRWPWVSRAEYDRLRGEREWLVSACSRSQESLAEARTEIRRLTDLIVELKREGYNPPVKPPDYTEPKAELPDEILEAIAARAPAKSDLERSLYRWATQVYTGQNADHVAATIWHGGDPDEDE